MVIYVKNLPNWERAARGVMGTLAVAFAVVNWGVSGVAVGAGVMGAVLALTGLVGFCPMCALVGRKLDKKA
jgi:ACR3 family arsenite efflux pump ArsB